MNTIDALDIGDVPELDMPFVDSAGTPADPASVTVRLQPPSGDPATFTYPADVEIERLALGSFKCTLPVTTVSGRHYVRVVWSGGITGAEEDSFFVRPSAFPNP